MLVQKKISPKKLAIFIFIIFFMICGTGFMLYQNKQLTTRKITNINDPMVFNNAMPGAVAIVPGSDIPGAGQAVDINKINRSGGLDLNIFSSDKFNNLRKNTFIVKDQTEVGKRDPFKPN
jgi:hypothetical protein